MKYEAGFQYVGLGVGVLIYNEKQEAFCAKRGEGAKNVHTILILQNGLNKIL